MRRGLVLLAALGVSGISNTFEANVRYSFTDPGALVLEEGFTTATAGTGTWGEYSFTVEFVTNRSGLGAVIAFEDDTDTVEPRDVHEVPVRMG